MPYIHPHGVLSTLPPLTLICVDIHAPPDGSRVQSEGLHGSRVHSYGVVNHAPPATRLTLRLMLMLRSSLGLGLG